MTEIGSLSLQNSLTLSSGQLTVTGTFDMATGTTLTATNTGTTLLAVGSTTVNATSLLANNGAEIQLPGLTSYAQTYGSAEQTWRASGNGSLLSLPNLEVIRADQTLYVQALAGGHVDLSDVDQELQGYVRFLSDGAGSVIDLSLVTSFLGYHNNWSGMTATNQGTILASNLATLTTSHITLDATGIMDTRGITSFTDGGILERVGRHRDFSSLALLDSVTVSVNSGGAITINPTAEPWSGEGIFLGTAASGDVAQYADELIAFSSQYDNGNYAATQALGPPDATGYGGYRVWVPQAQNGTTESITLGFSRPVHTTGVTIREARGNGFVTQVEVRDEASGDYHTVFSGTDPTAAGALADFPISFAATAFLVDAVRITIDTNLDTSAYEAIDAVQLHWTPPLNDGVYAQSAGSTTVDSTLTVTGGVSMLGGTFGGNGRRPGRCHQHGRHGRSRQLARDPGHLRRLHADAPTPRCCWNWPGATRTFPSLIGCV